MNTTTQTDPLAEIEAFFTSGSARTGAETVTVRTDRFFQCLDAARQSIADLRQASQEGWRWAKELGHGLDAAHAQLAEPIPMLLHCPKCHTQHIDAPESDEDYTKHLSHGGFDNQWDNPPHRSHLCHHCGTVWRPADVATTGVASIETRGKADTWPGAEASPDAPGVIPAGWRLVPVEPTPDMIRAAQAAPEGRGQKWHAVHRSKWAAMLTAAPAAPAVREGGRDVPPILPKPRRFWPSAPVDGSVYSMAQVDEIRWACFEAGKRSITAANHLKPLAIATDALDSIALAGMSGTGFESADGMQRWHADRAFEFIRIAAIARSEMDAAIAQAQAQQGAGS